MAGFAQLANGANATTPINSRIDRLMASANAMREACHGPPTWYWRSNLHCSAVRDAVGGDGRKSRKRTGSFGGDRFCVGRFLGSRALTSCRGLGVLRHRPWHSTTFSATPYCPRGQEPPRLFAISTRIPICGRILKRRILRWPRRSCVCVLLVYYRGIRSCRTYRAQTKQSAYSRRILGRGSECTADSA